MFSFALIENGRLTWGDDALLTRWRASDELILWVDSDSTDPRAETELLTQFGVPSFLLRDFQHPRRPPKHESYKNMDLLVFKGLDATTDDLDYGTIQLSMLLCERLLITRHDGESRSIARVTTGLNDGTIAVPGSVFELTFLITQTLFDRYLPIVLALEERLEAVEDEIFSNPDADYLEELTGYRTSLKSLRRYTAYHHTTMQSVQTAHESDMTRKEKRRLGDILETLDRLTSLQTLFYEMCTDLVEGYLSLSAHRLNQVMKVLTIVTVIFVPLSFLAGIYGMNFEHMPELGRPNAYFVLLGVMLFIAVSLLAIFKWRRWL